MEELYKASFRNARAGSYSFDIPITPGYMLSAKISEGSSKNPLVYIQAGGDRYCFYRGGNVVAGSWLMLGNTKIGSNQSGWLIYGDNIKNIEFFSEDLATCVISIYQSKAEEKFLDDQEEDGYYGDEGDWDEGYWDDDGWDDDEDW